MQIDRRLVGFGAFLITAGGAMAALRRGIVTTDVAASSVLRGR